MVIVVSSVVVAECDESVEGFLIAMPDEKDVIDEAEPKDGSTFMLGLEITKHAALKTGHENIGKIYSHGGSHGNAFDLVKKIAQKLHGVVLQDEADETNDDACGDVLRRPLRLRTIRSRIRI